MRGVGKEAILIAAKRREFIDKAYELFCRKSIDTVSLQDIANETNYGIATLYRYFTNKHTLVVEVAACKWDEFLKGNVARRPQIVFDDMTGAQIADEDLFYHLALADDDLFAAFYDAVFVVGK